MRTIDTKDIICKVKDMVQDINFNYPKDIETALHQAYEKETSIIGKETLSLLQQNATIARNQQIPICQDTGMVSIFLSIGQEVYIQGNLNDALQEGVRQGYQEGYLRKSMVDDPLFDRTNTKDNTPCVVYTTIIPGDAFELNITTKGFGSENMSRMIMLKPAQGVQGVKDFVLDTIAKAGPNACPPMVVGVGIGGSFDYACVLAKKATLRSVTSHHPDKRYEALEDELLTLANKLNIGPQGLKGDTSVLKVNIESFPTHIAGLPVAVNISCHVTRHAKGVL